MSTRDKSSAKCNGKHCELCLSINETIAFKSFQTKQKHKINHHLHCNDKYLIYLLSCKVCVLQCISSTTDIFRFRRNSYKENDGKALRGEEHMQPELFEHFAYGNHNYFLNNCSIALIDKKDGWDTMIREEYWRKVVKTASSYGLNTLNWWLLLHVFIYIFRGRTLVNVKCILSNVTCVSCKECYFCILVFNLVLLHFLV